MESLKSDRGFVTVLVTAVIPTILASSIVASAFSIFYSDYYKTPTICITVKPEKYSEAVVVEAKNHGRDSARGLVLTIESPDNIINKTILATENVTSIKQNHTILSLNLPRFSNGEGSVIKINVWTNSPQSSLIENMNAYATYEKGSIKYSSSNPQCPGLFTSFLLLPYSPLIILGILLLIAYFPLLVYVNRRIDRKIFLDLLTQDIMNVRALLHENPRLTDKLALWNLDELMSYLVFNQGTIFFISWIFFSWAGIIFLVRFYIYTKMQQKNRARESYIWDLKTYNSKRNIIKNMDDYIKIDDFYRCLKQRNKGSEEERARLNDECFNLSVQALVNLKWDIYR